jgi:peptidoglycan/LPS O-acetylase OafA/YrhL
MLGVDFFFVISGFLITYLLFYEKRIFGKIEIKSFLLRRLLRIWPLYFLVLFFDLVYFFFTSYKSFDVNFLFYPFFLGNIDRIINGLSTTGKFIDLNVLWSIAVEEQFYLIVPLVFFFINGHKKMFYFLLIFHSVIIGFKIFIIYYINDYGLAYRNLQFNPLSAFAAISMGCLISFLAFYNKELVIKVVNTKISWIKLIFFYLIFLSIYLDYKFDENIYVSEVLGIEVISIAFSLIILFTCYKNEKSNLKKSTLLKVFNYLGKISYGLYIYHFIVVFFISKLTDSLALLAVFSFGLTTLISVFSYNYFEKPILNLKKKYVKINTR